MPRKGADSSLLLTLRQGSVSSGGLTLRRDLFRGGISDDGDAQDAEATHVEISASGAGVVAYLRFRRFDNREIENSYAASVYDLSALKHVPGQKIEIGRVCARPGFRTPRVFASLLGAVKLAAAECGSHFLFGSSSLPGADHRQHLPALVWAWRNFPAPPSWRPGPRARDIVDARDHGDVTGNPAGLSQLLRFYLSAGARVSTHAVLDRDLGTTHLFTGLELPSGRI